MKTKYIFQPDYAIHPGETLAETLEELGMSQAQLAQRMGRPLQMISEIIQGKKAVTAETALQLERATGVPASFWDSAQRNYEATRARLSEDRELGQGVAWVKRFPLGHISKLGWVHRAESSLEQVRTLLNFFGVAGIKEWDELWQSPDAVFRKSTAFTSNPMAVAVWLRQGERQAQRVQCQAYDQERLIKALYAIRKLTITEPGAFEAEMRQRCGESGVAVVFVPEVPGARAYGATRWLTPQKALLQLSLRGKSDDFLWFTFFHEAAHILKHGKRAVFIEAPEGSADAEVQRMEEEANTFAADFLIPRDALAAFRKEPKITRDAIVRFASRLGIAPGIVVGRLQHERLIDFKQFNQLKRHFRFIGEQG